MTLPARKTTPVDPTSDIQDPKVIDALVKAQGLAKKIVESPESREPLALSAQDHLLALRALKVGYNAHAICLLENGDLFVYGAPCHPRDVAEKLVAGGDVGGLTDLVNELKAKLAYEAS